MFDELYDRGGFDHWWDPIGDDIKEEINEVMASIIYDNI